MIALPLAAQPDDLREGLAALNRNDLPAAQASLEKAAARDPRNPLVRIALAQTRLKQGRKEPALEAAAEAERLGPDSPPVQHALSLLYAETGDVSKAALWERRYASGPQRTGQSLARASALSLEAGEPAEALALLEGARTRFPDNPQIELNWGVACYSLRRPDDAVTAFLRVIQLDPSIVQPYVFLGRTLDNAADRLPEVIAAYAAWEARDPTNYLPPFLLGKALLASPEPDREQAESRLLRSIALNAGFWEAHRELGDCLTSLGKWTDAERELLRAVELNPSDARTHYDLAKIYLHRGRSDQARAERAEYERLRATEETAPTAKSNR